MNEHYVYIIAHARKGGGFRAPVKVGITKALGSRLATIQTGNWHPVQFAQVFNMETRVLALEAESMFHSIHKDCRLTGEWFDIEPFAALESLCSVVYALIEQMYPEEDCQEHWVESGAIDAMLALHRGVLQ